MSDITKFLGRLNGEPVCVFSTENNVEKFKFGRILAFNDEYTALYEIAPNGNYDGVSVIPTDSISHVESGGQYAEKMNKLTSPESYGQFPYTIGTEDIRGQMLEIAHRERKVIRLEILESGIFDVIGIIEGIGDGVVSVLQVDEYGYEDGHAMVLSDDITTIAYCGDEERTIQRLWEINYQ